MTLEEFTRGYFKAIATAEAALGLRLDRWRGSHLTCGEGEHKRQAVWERLDTQAPHYHWLPGLRAQPFWHLDDMSALYQDRLSAFQERLGELREELQRAREGAHFRPAGHTHVGEVAAWKQLPIRGLEEQWLPICERLPTLMTLLATLEEDTMIQGSIYFATLDGHLPLHCGGNNGRLVLHLPLHVPTSEVGIRCGGELRRWRVGEWTAIDDTYPHEAWNHSGELRLILLFTCPHPDFSPVERRASKMIKTLMSPLYREYFAVRALETAKPEMS